MLFKKYVFMLQPANTPIVAAIGRRVVAGVFQGLPCAFQKDAMLRIGQRRFAFAHVEESGVELVDVDEHRAGLDVIGRCKGRGIGAVFKLVIGKEGNALDAVAQILARMSQRPGRPEIAPTCR